MGNWKLRDRRILEDQGADGRIILQQTEITLDKARFGNLRWSWFLLYQGISQLLVAAYRRHKQFVATWGLPRRCNKQYNIIISTSLVV